METTVFFDQVGKAIGKAGDVIAIKLENPRLWSPDHPFLYKMQVGSPKPTETTNPAIFLAIVGNSGQVELSSGDEVHSYAGLRTIQLAGKEEDKKIILLNGKPLDFQVVTIPKSSFTIQYPSTCSNMNSWSQFLFLYPLKDIFFWPDSFL